MCQQGQRLSDQHEYEEDEGWASKCPPTVIKLGISVPCLVCLKDLIFNVIFWGKVKDVSIKLT